MILDITDTCNNSILFTFLVIVKTILNLLHVIVPLLLILSLTISLTKLVQDPDEKKAPKNIVNSLLATVIIFFLPTFVNVVIDLVAGESDFGNCWRNASIKSNLSFQYQDIDSGNKQKIDNGTYEPGNKQTEPGGNSSLPSNGGFDLEHAIKVASKPHKSEHENLPWHGATVGSHAGMIGAYVEAINILNGTDYTLLEIYNKIISLHPEQKSKNVPVYENEDVNDFYHLKVERAPANMSEIKKALSEGKLVAEIVDTTKWRNDKGKLFGKTGRHTGLIFYFDGSHYHMKTSVQPNGIYTESQLSDWLGNTSNKLVIYSKK